MKGNEKFVLKAVQQNGMSLEGASKELQKKCKVAFDTVNTDGDEELSMSEFQQFMADREAVDGNKKNGFFSNMGKFVAKRWKELVSDCCLLEPKRPLLQ